MASQAPAPPKSTPTELHRQKYAFGSTFWKEFPGHGHFKGTVTAFHPFAGLYRITYYDDGDSEDLTEAEITFLLSHNGNMPATSDNSAVAVESLTSYNDCRRSKRRRVSTIVKVDGYHVKAENNYTVRGGAYVYEQAGPELLVAKRRQAQAQKNVTTKQPPPQRKMAPCEVTRIHHNNTVKASIKKKQPFRRSFLSQHKTILEPFMDDKTRRKLAEWSTDDVSQGYVHRELFVQPELVTGGELRDYQLVGLNFLVDKHRQNVGMILGDEMGLVRFPCTLVMYLVQVCETNHTFFVLDCVWSGQNIADHCLALPLEGTGHTLRPEFGRLSSIRLEFLVLRT